MCKSLNDYSTGNLLSCDYFLNHCKLILIDLAQQDISLDKQQINFIGKLNEDTTIFFIIEETRKIALEFSQNFVNIEEEEFSKESVDSEEESEKFIKFCWYCIKWKVKRSLIF